MAEPTKEEWDKKLEEWKKEAYKHGEVHLKLTYAVEKVEKMNLPPDAKKRVWVDVSNKIIDLMVESAELLTKTNEVIDMLTVVRK